MLVVQQQVICAKQETIQKKSCKLKAEIFHNMVARGSFLTNRSRGNVHTAMSFSCTRAQSPNTGNWKNSLCIVKCLHQTVKLVPRLGVRGLSVIEWHADVGEFNLNPNSEHQRFHNVLFRNRCQVVNRTTNQMQ